MTSDDLQQPHVLGTALTSATFRDNAGDVASVSTNWGFAVFAVLAASAFVAGTPGLRVRLAATAVVGGAASVLAAGVGLAVKAAVAEPRPCQVHPGAAQWSRCPPAGDWSFPSNHSVFAGALAVTVVALAVFVGRYWLATLGVVTGVAIAVSRVILGVHFWWDVVAGLALGGAVAATALMVLARAMPAPDAAGGRRRHLSSTW